MDNKEKVIRKLVEFCKAAEGDTTPEERGNTITNTAEVIVKLFAIPVVVCSFCEKEPVTHGLGETKTVCGKCWNIIVS